MFQQAQASSPRATILVADDFVEWRVRVRKILRERPEWEVIGEACDGFEVVQKAQELQPDVVLLDIGMPMLNGLLAAVRSDEQHPLPKLCF